MGIDAILKEQSEWLEEASRRIEKLEVSPNAIAEPAALKERRLKQIDGRIARLTAQKEQAIKRYDEAIAAERAEMEKLAKELDWNRRGPRPGSGRSERPGQTKRPKKRSGRGGR